MIWVDRRKVPIPDSLRTSTEARRSKEHLDDNGNLNGFSFKDYKSRDVRKALEDLFHGKCAYCETHFTRHPEDVEHYRPKSGVMVAGKLRALAYWWLAAEWTNLFPACPDCNRYRMREVIDGTSRLTGKGCHFPLTIEAKRAREPGGEAREQPLLLNPCVDRPEKYIAFPNDKEGAISVVASDQTGKRRAKTTIALLGLDDRRISAARQEWWSVLQGRLKDASNIIDDLVEARGVTRAKKRQQLSEKRAELARMSAYDRPYLAMVSPVVRRVLVTIDKHLARTAKPGRPRGSRSR